MLKIREIKAKSKIAMYSGPGAGTRDIEFALKLLKIPYRELNKKTLKDKLNNFQTLIMPGGTTEIYVRSLSKNLYPIIRDFISKGNKYIGICAGAYLAPKECICLKKGKRVKLPGLGIINVRNIRGTNRRRPGRFREIKFKKHFLTKGLPPNLKIWYRNGPTILPGKNVKAIAVYENNLAAIVFSRFRKGKVVLFSPHPEGDFQRKINPKEIGTLHLLKNAINF